MITLLVYGHKGWIGGQFIKHVMLKHESVTVILGQARLDNIPDLVSEIDQHKPDSVVCFTGRTHGKIGDNVYSTIDYLEQEGKLVDNVRDNLFAPICCKCLPREKGTFCLSRNRMYFFI